MGKMRTIVVTIVLIFMVIALPAVGRLVELPAADSDRKEVAAMGTIYAGQTFWAQNDIGENEKTESSNSDTEAPKTEPADDDKGKSSESKSKPLKPFIPSEKIPGEQAVDFPVDI